MDKVLKIKYHPWYSLFLPFWWHRIIVEQWHPATTKVLRNNIPGTLYLNHSIKVAICLHDRCYIDEALVKTDIHSSPVNQKWQAYLDAGMALYDLGYRDEGVAFLEEAVKISYENEHQSIMPYISLYALCCRLNDKKNWEKRYEYTLDFTEKFPREGELAKRLLAKSYIDQKEFVKANQVIKELTDIHVEYKIFLADYYYCKEDYQLASAVFSKHRLDEIYSYWHAQYDYKEAVAYFKTGHLEDWQRKAKAIGRRLAWDKFFSLDYLESEGIQRISEIDKVIDASRNQKRWIYPDKMLLILKRLPWVLWKTILMYRYWLFCLSVLTLFFVMLFLDCLRYLKGK